VNDFDIKGENGWSGLGEANCKLPCILDMSSGVKLFESGSIALLLAEMHDRFLPRDAVQKAEVINWIMWQTASLEPSMSE